MNYISKIDKFENLRDEIDARIQDIIEICADFHCLFPKVDIFAATPEAEKNWHYDRYNNTIIVVREYNDPYDSELSIRERYQFPADWLDAPDNKILKEAYNLEEEAYKRAHDERVKKLKAEAEKLGFKLIKEIN